MEGCGQNMIHPTCGSDLRRGTKVVAMMDSILSGFSIFCGIAVLNNMFLTIKDPDSSAFPVGCMLVFIILIGIEIYLAFRLYRAAHERDVQKLRTWKKAAGAVMLLSGIFVLFLKHTTSTPTTPPPGPDPRSPYPLLWFYVIYFVSAILRAYMIWIVHIFISEFEV